MRRSLTRQHAFIGRGGTIELKVGRAYLALEANYLTRGEWTLCLRFATLGHGHRDWVRIELGPGVIPF